MYFANSALVLGYMQKLNPYFGATVGRVANRIGNATFTIDGNVYNVSANLGKFTLHGGYRGFDKVMDNTKNVMVSYSAIYLNCTY